MSYRDNERYRKVYSYFRPVPRPADPTYSAGVTKDYVDDLFNSLDWKQSVTYASTKNVDITAVHTQLTDVDDHWTPADPDTFVDEDRVLLKNQTDPKENGLYIWYTATSKFVRTLDGVQDSLTCGATCYIDRGTHCGEVWVLESGDPITVDTTGQLWSFLVSISGSADTEIAYFTSSLAGYLSTTGSVAFNGSNPSTNTYNVGADVFFYVSGSISGSGMDDRKAVFGGDVVVSGTTSLSDVVIGGDLSVSGNLGVTGSMFISGAFDIFSDVIEITGSFYSSGSAFTVTTDTMIVNGAVNATQGFSGSLTNLVDGTSYIAAGNNITVVSSSNGQVVIGAIVPYITGTWSDLGNSFVTTSSVAIGTSSLLTTVGTDVFFFVSGTTNLTGTSSKVSVFGGDLVVSGGVNLVGDIIEISGSLYVSGGVFDVMADTLEVTGTVIATAGMQVGGVSNASVGSDAFFYVSGSMSASGSNDKKAVFGGDVRISGSIKVFGGVALNTLSCSSGPGTVYFVSASTTVVVFDVANVTASLPTNAPIGTFMIFKDGAGAAGTSQQLVSASLGRIDGAATKLLSASNYSSLKVVKIGETDVWITV